ncbi:hypothetical protein, partial [Exiguobacterium sp. s141]|uniref:hypothetical protein n=1 Tax=Exiguobacterium sp. s141 TaxID=2751240 RepID=UPI001BEACB9C
MKKWVSLIVVMLLVFSSFNWRVLGAPDFEAPKLISYSTGEGRYTVGDQVPVEIRVSDNLSKQPWVT